MSSIRAVWYIAVYGVSALVLMALADWRLGVPTLLWFAGYVLFLRYFVPRMRDLAQDELGSALAGHGARRRQLHQHPHRQAVRARSPTRTPTCAKSIDEHQAAIAAHMQLITQFMFALSAMNAALLAGTAAIGIALWAQGDGRARAWSRPRCRSPGRSPTSPAG